MINLIKTDNLQKKHLCLQVSHNSGIHTTLSLTHNISKNINAKEIMVQKAALLLISIIITLTINAQDTLNTKMKTNFTLEQSIKYAIDHNKDLQNKRLEVKSAKKEVWETTARGLPQAEATFDYSYIFDEAIELPFPDPMNPGENSKVEFKPTSNFKFQANQLIFSGEYIVGLQSAKIFKQLSKQNVEKTKYETIESVSNAYIMILVLRENKNILEKNLKTINKNIYEMKEMYKEGFIEDTDVDQLKISRSNIKTSLSSVKRQIKLSHKMLKINMGMPLKNEIKLTDSLSFLMDKMIQESLNNLQFKPAQNIEYQILETQKELKKMELRREQVSYLPTISGFYSHTEKIKKPEFDMNPNDLVGLNVSIPIFSSGQRLMRVQQAKIEMEKMKNNQEALADGLSMEYQQARTDYSTAFDKYLNEKENKELSKRIYDKTMTKYKEGLATSLDLSQVQSQHLQAQTNYFNAILELIQAKTKLDKLVNNTEK